MSHHIIHVLKHGCSLHRDRGFVVCRGDDKSENRLPIEDVRAVIIAARGVHMSSNFISGVLEQQAIILHCDSAYQPCGMTVPLSRITDQRAFLNQSARPARLNERLWQTMLRGKTLNQRSVLHRRQITSPHLDRALQTGEIDEANCARRYWQLYFPAIGYTGTKRERSVETPPNQMLNYGYAVLAALCHRALVIYGLSPLLGVKHTTRYQAHPLVYDLMEPFRPSVDLMIAEFLLEPDVSLKAWCKKVGTQLRETRVRYRDHSLKLMDAIDASACSLARSYSEKSSALFWVPEL